MRIIGGKFKGKAIIPPKNFKARPTTDFAKEGLFNILINQFNLSDLSVLDLFGGTGSITYEFISRGVKNIHTVEMNPVHAGFIKKSVTELTDTDIYAQVIRHNVFDFIEICTLKFDLIFADPPYDIDGLENIPDKIFTKGLLSEDGILILEHPAEYDFSKHPRFQKNKKYGNVNFTFFHR